MRGTQLDPPPRDMHVQAGSPSGLAWLQGVINEKRMHVAVGKRIEQRTPTQPSPQHSLHRLSEQPVQPVQHRRRPHISQQWARKDRTLHLRPEMPNSLETCATFPRPTCSRAVVGYSLGAAEGDTVGELPLMAAGRSWCACAVRSAAEAGSAPSTETPPQLCGIFTDQELDAVVVPVGTDTHTHPSPRSHTPPLHLPLVAHCVSLAVSCAVRMLRIATPFHSATHLKGAIAPVVAELQLPQPAAGSPAHGERPPRAHLLLPVHGRRRAARACALPSRRTVRLCSSQCPKRVRDGGREAPCALSA
jgi:hypothetical protein